MSALTIYTTPGCPACHAAKLRMRAADLDFQEIDFATDPAALSYVKDELGYEQAPVTVYRAPSGEVQTWGGFRMDRIRQAAAEQQAVTASADPAEAGPNPSDHFDMYPTATTGGGRDALILGRSIEPPVRADSPSLNVA